MLPFYKLDSFPPNFRSLWNRDQASICSFICSLAYSSVFSFIHLLLFIMFLPAFLTTAWSFLPLKYGERKEEWGRGKWGLPGACRLGTGLAQAVEGKSCCCIWIPLKILLQEGSLLSRKLNLVSKPLWSPGQACRGVERCHVREAETPSATVGLVDSTGPALHGAHSKLRHE